MLTKVYTNTLMMLINSRARIRLLMMRAESPRLSRPLQWVLDTSSRTGSDAGPGEGDSENSRDPPFELVSWKMPIIEAYAHSATEAAKPLTPLTPNPDAESSKASGSCECRITAPRLATLSPTPHSKSEQTDVPIIIV